MQKAAAMKVAIRPEALPLAVEALLAAKGQSGMTLGDVGNTHMARALVDEVSADRLETVLKNAALRDGLKQGDLPVFHSAAVTSLLNELKTSFGSGALPDNLASVLEMKAGNDFQSLGDVLDEAVAQSVTTVAPTDLRALIEQQLKPLAQRRA